MLRICRNRKHLCSLVSGCTLVCFVCALVPVSAPCAKPATPNASSHADKPRYLHLHDHWGIKRAMQAGNSNRLKALSNRRSKPLLAEFAKAAYYRSLFKLAQSSYYARLCYHGTTKINLHTVGPVIFCGNLLAGNDLMIGKVSNWAHTMRRTRDRTYLFIENLDPKKQIIFPGFGSYEYPVAMDKFFNVSTPQVTTSSKREITVDRVDLPSRSYRDSTGMHNGGKSTSEMPMFYVVSITINGHHTTALLDTGSYISAMSPRVASALGIHIIVGNFYKASTISGISKIPTRLGQAMKISIGKGKYRFSINGPIFLVGEEFGNNSRWSGNPRVIIGLSAIRWFGSVLISHNKITIHPKNVPCSIPLHISSNIGGGYALLSSIIVNNEKQFILIDTGTNTYINGTALAHFDSSAQEHLESTRAVNGIVASPYYLSSITVGRGAATETVQIEVFPNQKRPFPYVMGDRILRHYDIYIDFKYAHLCLIPRKYIRNTNKAGSMK